MTNQDFNRAGDRSVDVDNYDRGITPLKLAHAKTAKARATSSLPVILKLLQEAILIRQEATRSIRKVWQTIMRSSLKCTSTNLAT